MQKTALVTGASRGLGLSIVEEFRGRGWRVVALVRTAEDAAILAGKEEVVPVLADIRSPQVSGAISQALACLGGSLDALVNNAGQGGKGVKLDHLETNIVEDLLNTHCLGAIRVTQSALPFLRRSESSAVINITSRFASLGLLADGSLSHADATYAYRIAKAAQNMFSLSLHRELSALGMRVYAVHPGVLATSMNGGEGGKDPAEAAEAIADIACGYSDVPPGGFYSVGEGILPW